MLARRRVLTLVVAAVLAMVLVAAGGDSGESVGRRRDRGHKQKATLLFVANGTGGTYAAGQGTDATLTVTGVDPDASSKRHTNFPVVNHSSPSGWFETSPGPKKNSHAPRARRVKPSSSKVNVPGPEMFRLIVRTGSPDAARSLARGAAIRKRI